MIRVTGIPVSPGVAWGPVALLLQHSLALRYAIAEVHVPREVARLVRARDLSREQLDSIRTRVAASAGPDLARLFEAQILMLDDRLLVPRARALITAEHVNAEWAVQRAFDELSALFGDAGDDYVRERRGDVADVVGRLHRNLRAASGLRREWLAELDRPSILLADDLPPSVAGQLDKERVLGLAIDAGSRTHHSAILARSMGLPAVVGLGRASQLATPGTLVLLDGTTGELIIDPPADMIEQARRRRSSAMVRIGHAAPVDARPVLTADGVPIRIDANIEQLSDAEAAKAAGAQGVGLFRSEYILGSCGVDALDEDAQFALYRELLTRMAPLPVTIRTFDLDEAQAAGRARSQDDVSDAGSPGMSGGPLGMRGLRLSLSWPDAFHRQLRALVRAARHGQLRILFPFVTSVDELRAARQALRSAEAEVALQDGHHPEIPAGAMIEVPSAAVTADLMADEVDFLSLGTNDLVQYCLAVDRTDRRMASLYDPLHPAILRIVRFVVSAARARGREVAVCGEMAADPAPLALLIGLGVTTLSMSPSAMAGARAVIQQIRLADVRRLARSALRQRTGADVAALMATMLG